MADYPRIEHGFYHLLSDGWCRKDHQPFPEERLETWSYEMEQPAEDAKEHINLTRTWKRPGISAEGLQAFHVYFGEALLPSVCRNVTLECDV
ncbi:MAG TPA: hypothetical protein VN175_01375 [Rhizomicrobium sp.]|nr:hypothetical protein [Rhizomicrobium sp.]